MLIASKNKPVKAIYLSRNNGLYLWLATLFSLALLMVGKDLLHAYLRDSSFYLSESLLFGLFWLLFVPNALLIGKLSKKTNRLLSLLYSVSVSLLHIFLFSLLVFGISASFFYHTFGFFSVLINTLGDNGLSCLLVYTTISLLVPFVKESTQHSKEISGKIKVPHQGEVIMLSTEDIIYITTERPYLAIITKEKKYLHSSSLKNFQRRYLSADFIRIHKSTIVRRDGIKSFRSRKNGDFDVLMINGATLRASRTYNTYFKTVSQLSG